MTFINPSQVLWIVLNNNDTEDKKKELRAQKQSKLSSSITEEIQVLFFLRHFG